MFGQLSSEQDVGQLAVAIGVRRVVLFLQVDVFEVNLANLRKRNKGIEKQSKQFLNEFGLLE